MPQLIDAAKDAALNYVRSNATVLHVCSSEPTSFANVASVTLGNKSAPTINAPEDATGGGRKIVCAAVTDGTVTGDGTGSHWALVSGTELLAANALAATQSLTNGNTLTLSAFDAVTIPDATSA
jgi:hypothetical protein